MNIYTKTIIAAATIAVGTICFSDLLAPAHSNAGGAPAGKTGSPGDGGANCTGCHSGTATTSAGLITSTVPVTGYIPGDTYTVTATISVAGINKYGFEISPQNTTGVLKGTMIVTDAVQTKLISLSKYITHKSTGTAGTGTKTWSFNWTAPVAGSGNATFYGAFVAANGNGTNSGDQVFLSNLLVQENLSAAIVENSDKESNWTVYPNPSKERLYIESLDADNKIKAIALTDITGKLIKTIDHDELSQNQSIDIADLQSGMYVLTIQSEKGRAVKKIIKD